MRDRIRRFSIFGACISALVITCLQSSRPALSSETQASAGVKSCRVIVLDGEASAGQPFDRQIGNELRVLLDPMASGWILRVIPALGPRGRHDYAELATPPFHSISPLSISTDFSFRAQDALAWNPRHFRFASDQRSFTALQDVYDEYQRSAEGSQTHRADEVRLAELAAKLPEAEIILIDAHLFQGTADQAGTAAMVASHLNISAHQVDQPADGRSTPLGRLNWIRFRLLLDLPENFRVAPGLKVKRGNCL